MLANFGEKVKLPKKCLEAMGCLYFTSKLSTWLRWLSQESACSWQLLLSTIRETLHPESSYASRYVQQVSVPYR